MNTPAVVDVVVTVNLIVAITTVTSANSDL
jgi:hypothetical protein